VPKRR
jgi:hypothetical protein